jgi:hypothetical protein
LRAVSIIDDLGAAVVQHEIEITVPDIFQLSPDDCALGEQRKYQ